jgi:L-malate glycosyltransferase
VELFKSIPCPVYTFPLRRTYDWNALRVAFRLGKLIRSERVNIVHTLFETSDLFGGLVAKLSGCPVLVSSRRDMGIFRTAKHRLGYRIISPMVDRVLAVSDQVRTFCVQQDGLDPNKVVTLYNGVDLERVGDSDNGGTRRSLGLAQASHVITTVGHVRKVKGIDLFVRAAAIVCREFPRVRFLVVGEVSEPDTFRELQELCGALGLAENVRFVGASEQVFPILNMSNVFCLLSRSEGFSNALIEAMGCGLPCVATRVGGNSEAIENNVSGFLVDGDSPEEAADRILTLMRHPAQARLMGQAARETVKERFTVQAMMKQWTKVYDSLVDSRGR